MKDYFIRDFFMFRRMIMPVFMILGWIIATLAVAILALTWIFGDEESRQILGWPLLVFGPIGVRMFFELLTVTFSINENLTDIRLLLLTQHQDISDVKDALDRSSTYNRPPPKN